MRKVEREGEREYAPCERLCATGLQVCSSSSSASKCLHSEKFLHQEALAVRTFLNEKFLKDPDEDHGLAVLVAQIT